MCVRACVCVCVWGGGTSSKYIVEMQPRWYTNIIIMNKLELWTNPDDGGGVAFTQNMWDTGLVDRELVY